MIFRGCFQGKQTQKHAECFAEPTMVSSEGKCILILRKVTQESIQLEYQNRDKIKQLQEKIMPTLKQNELGIFSTESTWILLFPTIGDVL